MSSDEESDDDVQRMDDLLEGAFDCRLSRLYTDLKECIQDSVSKSGSGWARKQLKTAFQLHDILLQLAHWGTDIRNTEYATLDKVEVDDATFANVIRVNLVFAQMYVRKLQKLLEKVKCDSTAIDAEFETTLLESIRTSVQGLQQQVGPLRAFIDARDGTGMAGAIKMAVQNMEESISQKALIDIPGHVSGEANVAVDRRQSSQSFSEDEIGELEEVPPVVAAKTLKVNSGVTDLIRRSALTNVEGRRFWPTRLLTEIMTKQRILQALEQECSDLARYRLDDLANLIIPEKEPQKPLADFLKVFVILLLMEKGNCIKRFIADGLGDDNLPLFKRYEARRLSLFRSEGDNNPIRAFHDWKDFEIEFFFDTQWQVLTPDLESKDSEVLTLDKNIILPWLSCGMGDADNLEGGFGSVRKAQIYKSSLSSSHVISNHVAVKSMRTNDTTYFDNEVEALTRVNKLKHDHFVKLLATYKSEDRNFLILPWAECDLETYWKTHPGPLVNIQREKTISSLDELEAAWEQMKWVSEQLHGIADGLAAIHYRLVQDSLIHGDLKPGNILLMDAADGSQGRLVIADFGVSRIYQEDDTASRNDAWTPAYRPPERDIKNVPVSRSFDIWSLGCVFSEMICWILGGYELKANFEGRRIARDLNGLSSFTFFEIVSQDDHHVARIKPAITQFFDELRALPQCTQYIRDLLDLVQYDMLVVNSEDKERISSKELVHRLKKMDTRISKDLSYATERVTLPSEPPTVLPLPVKVVPSELAGVLEKKMAAKLARGSLAAVTAYAAGSVSDTAWVVASKLSGQVSDAMRQISKVTAPIVK